MARHTPPDTCPACGALVGDLDKHTDWHRDVTRALVRQHLLQAAAVRMVAGDDDAPTAKLPPIRETVLRRPPVAVRELKGPELLRALADAMDADGLDVEDLDR